MDRWRQYPGICLLRLSHTDEVEWVVMQVRAGKIEECVEALCHQGCRMVYRYISALQQGEEFPEVAELSRTERLMVLKELVAIMDIYDGSCDS
jgi:hypothetical protein